MTKNKRAGGGVPSGIAVLGSHPATVMQAPFDQDWLIYACSPHNVEERELPRFDEWFEIHKPIADKTRGYRYLRYLEDVPLVWMRDKDAMPLFKNAQEYPEEELKKEFCSNMFTSSIAFIQAKAIMKCMELGIKQIGLWGVMQASKTEYFYQRPGIQYFIWEALRRDIDVICPEASHLFQPPEENF